MNIILWDNHLLLQNKNHKRVKHKRQNINKILKNMNRMNRLRIEEQSKWSQCYLFMSRLWLILVGLRIVVQEDWRINILLCRRLNSRVIREDQWSAEKILYDFISFSAAYFLLIYSLIMLLGKWNKRKHFLEKYNQKIIAIILIMSNKTLIRSLGHSSKLHKMPDR